SEEEKRQPWLPFG
uniref:Peroniin-1.1b n=1 Tax=Litoria peronii TaxID=317363 RepID=PE11B_LITPE|nr:RecName: Full=Peroniin-1.1b [Litoria peronii]